MIVILWWKSIKISTRFRDSTNLRNIKKKIYYCHFTADFSLVKTKWFCLKVTRERAICCCPWQKHSMLVPKPATSDVWHSDLLIVIDHIHFMGKCSRLNWKRRSICINKIRRNRTTSLVPHPDNIMYTTLTIFKDSTCKPLTLNNFGCLIKVPLWNDRTSHFWNQFMLGQSRGL